MALTKEERAARKAVEKAERLAEQEAELQKTIDLVTALYWNLTSGECLTNEQIASCRHDRVLGIVWWRIMDYAEYRSRTMRLPHVKDSDDTSIYLEYDSRQCSADVQAMIAGNCPKVWFSDKQRVKALEDGAKAKARILKRGW